MNKYNDKGFTLVEIMVVVVIIGILAALAIPAFQKARQASQEKTIINNLRQLGSGAEQYFLEQGIDSVSTTTLIELTGRRVKEFDSVSATGDNYTNPITTSLTALTASNPSGGLDISILF